MDSTCIFQHVNNGADWQKEEAEKRINEVLPCLQKQHSTRLPTTKHGYFKCDGAHGCCSAIASFLRHLRMTDVLF